MRFPVRYFAAVALILASSAAHAQSIAAGVRPPSPRASFSRTQPDGFARGIDSVDSGLPHGLIGGAIGAIVGAGLGHLRLAMDCEGGSPCDTSRGIAIGAAAGAALGVVLEYFIRNGPRKGQGVVQRTSSPCRHDTGSSARMLSAYHYTVVLDDSSATAWRQGIGLFARDSNQVTLVSDIRICRTALMAYNNALLPDSLSSTSVDVVKYGRTRFIVADSARRRTEWTPAVVFNAEFTQVVAKIGQ